jgi:biotin transport system substrate-specific component
MLVTMRTALSARPAWQLRVLRIALFAILTALSARLVIDLPNNPVPITAQTLIVWLAGLTLGPVDGALSQVAYVGAIALGAPLDARGLGPAVFLSPTAGYLIGFIPGAFVAGLGVRRPLALKVLAALSGVVVVHILGIAGIALAQHISFDAAIGFDVAFIPVDFGKALLAASLVNLGYTSWQRWGSSSR